MKRGLKPLTIMFLLSHELRNPVTGQRNIAEYEADIETMPAEKGTPVYLGDQNYEISTLETDFPKAALRFTKLYPLAQSPLWIKEGNSLHVYFQENGNKISALFTIKGNMIYAITDLNAAAIPEKIKQAINQDYFTCTVFSAKHIKAGINTAYQVILDNCTEFISIHTDEEEIVGVETIHKYRYPLMNVPFNIQTPQLKA